MKVVNIISYFYTKLFSVYQKNAETNEHCLNRLGKKFKKILVVKDHESAVEAVITGQVIIPPFLNAVFLLRISVLQNWIILKIFSASYI